MLKQGEEQQLAQDLISAANLPNYGRDFDVKMIDSETLNPFILYVNAGGHQWRTIVTLESYPSTRPPIIEITKVNSSEPIKVNLQLKTASIAQPPQSIVWRVSDIVIGVIELMQREVSNRNQSGLQNQAPIPSETTKIQGRSSIVQTFRDFVTNRGDSRGRQNDYPQHAGGQSQRSSFSSDRNNLNATGARYAFEPQVVSRVVIRDNVFSEIEKAYRLHKPNEICFLCSGLLMNEGIALCETFYGGVMDKNSSVYCSLTEEFIAEVIYDLRPPDHNLIVWGHIHPISSPSGMDSSSFEEIARWEHWYNSENASHLQSIAMLIDSHDFIISFFDVHSHKKIPHQRLSSPQGRNYVGHGRR